MACDSKGKLLRKFSIFSNEALDVCQTALEFAQTRDDSKNPSAAPSISSVASLPRYQDSSDEEEGADAQDENPSDSCSDESDDEPNEGGAANAAAPLAESVASVKLQEQEHQRQETRQTKEKPTMDEKQRQATILRHIQHLPCIPLPCDESSALYFPSCLLSKEERYNSQTSAAKSALDLATSLTKDNRLIIILCVRSGRFAAAVYQQQKCLDHTTSQRYTVRKGQGKAQSTQDGNRRPKSMGAQLRRAGEQLLKQDIHKTLLRWQPFIQQSALILLSCPKTMLKDVLEGEVLQKSDKRLRRVPLDVGRPSFETVGIIHAVLTCITVREHRLEIEEQHAAATALSADDAIPMPESKDLEESVAADDDAPPEVPLTPLHIAARDGDVDALTALLESQQQQQQEPSDWINAPAGEYLMTPLHFAALCDDWTNAAACVLVLLVTGRADPCAVDVRNRVPWFLATSDKVRESFRKARAELGEGYCNWDDAKVAAALTDDDLQRRKDIEAEKRRKKRARQKQKKAEDKAVEDARAQQQREEAERQRQEEEAKRIRDGLQPKPSAAANLCDFCQTSKKGLKRRDMFKRLDYVYCSTACVERHKRELMAAAALKRIDN